MAKQSDYLPPLSQEELDLLVQDFEINLEQFCVKHNLRIHAALALTTHVRRRIKNMSFIDLDEPKVGLLVHMLTNEHAKYREVAEKLKCTRQWVGHTRKRIILHHGPEVLMVPCPSCEIMYLPKNGSLTCGKLSCKNEWLRRYAAHRYQRRKAA